MCAVKTVSVFFYTVKGEYLTQKKKITWEFKYSTMIILRVS